MGGTSLLDQGDFDELWVETLSRVGSAAERRAATFERQEFHNLLLRIYLGPLTRCLVIVGGG